MADKEPSTNPSQAPISQPYLTYPSFLSYLHRAVRSRVPRLPSLRRSFSAPNLQQLTDADTRIAPLASNEGPKQVQVAGTRPARPASEGMVSSTSAFGGVGNGWTSMERETSSGVDWWTAETGLMLVNRAYTRASQDAGAINTSAVRSQHIHGLVYLLRSLPSDLEPAEIRQLQNVLPDELRIDWTSASTSRAKGNLLSRSIAFVMLQCAIFLAFLLPLLLGLSDRLLQYEREHHVVQKLLRSSGQTIETLGERGLDVHEAVVSFSQRRVGSALFGAVIWIAEGVVQGINEGAGRSAVIFGSALALRSDEREQ